MLLAVIACSRWRALLVAVRQHRRHPRRTSGRDLADKVTVDGMYAHLQQVAGHRRRQRGQPGRRHARLRRQRRLRREGVARQGFRRRRRRSSSGSRCTRPGKPTLTVAGRGFPVDQASLLVTTAPGGLPPSRLRPGRSRPDARPPITARCRRARARSPSSTTPAARWSTSRTPPSARVPSGCWWSATRAPRAARPGLFTPGLLPAAQDPGRGHRQRRRRRSCAAPSHRCGWCSTPSRRWSSRETCWRRPRPAMRTTSWWRARTSTRAAQPRHQRQRVAAWRRCWRPRCSSGASPPVTNAVRFAFWGAEEAGQKGRRTTFADLTATQLQRYRAVPELRPARLAQRRATSPTTATSPANPTPASRPPAVPAGSAGVERTLAGYLNLAGVRPADMPLGRTSRLQRRSWPRGSRSAASPRARSQRKTEVQARLWGGKAGVSRSIPNYHTARDTIDNVDRARCRSWARRSRSPSAPTRSRSTASTGFRARDQRHPGQVCPSHPGDELVDAVLVGRQRARPRVR